MKIEESLAADVEQGPVVPENLPEKVSKEEVEKKKEELNK